MAASSDLHRSDVDTLHARRKAEEAQNRQFADNGLPTNQHAFTQRCGCVFPWTRAPKPNRASATKGKNGHSFGIQ